MKILCIRLKAIGDLVTTTPVYRVLSKQLGAQVHVLAMKVPALMLTGNPYVTKIVAYEQPDLVEVLHHENYDLVVDLHCNLRSHKLRLQLGLPSVGYFKRNLDKWLLTKGVDRLGEQHIVDRYFLALKPLGVENDGAGLDYFLQPEELDAARRAVASNDSFCVLVLAATHHTKRIPESLAVEIIEQLDTSTVLLGGDDVLSIAEQVLAKAPKNKVINLCGKVPLRVSAAVLQLAWAVITPDTGLMHMAAALRRPTVVVWGNTAPPFGMYPYLPKEEQGLAAYAQVGKLSCQPCSRIGYASCPQGHFRCMADQSAKSIVQQAKKVADFAHSSRSV